MNSTSTSSSYPNDPANFRTVHQHKIETDCQDSLSHSPTDSYEVSLLPEEHPQNFSNFRKWTAVVIIGAAAMCVTCASSMASFTEKGLVNDFEVSQTVAILSISLFVEGLGIGPLFVGPLSEVYGRNIVYRISYAFLLVFSFPVAFAPNIAIFLIFRFLTGLCGSAFLTVAGGSVSDMFTNDEVANPMAFYTLNPFLGPIVGALASGFINQNLHWRWTYWILIIWTFAIWVGLCTVVPETYVPVLLKQKSAYLQTSTGDNRYYASLPQEGKSLLSAVLVSCYRPFQLLLNDGMAFLLDMWFVVLLDLNCSALLFVRTAVILGILYLAFQAFPIIFRNGHHFSVQSTGLTFLGIGVGMIIGVSTQPWWNRYFARKTAEHNGHPPPEIRLVAGMYGGILVPIGLFCLAFTSEPHVPWILPIIASIPFGTGMYFVFTSVFTYLVVAYRPISASAMAANSALRSLFAAVFPLFSKVMYDRLGTVGATALLAGLTTLMAPLPFIFYKIGSRLRSNSQFAVK